MNKHCSALLALSFWLALGLGLPGQVSAGQQLQKINEEGQVTVGFDSNAPFVYMDASRKLTGFEVELAEAIAKELGVKAKFRPSKQDNLVASLINGYSAFGSKRIDLIIGKWTVTDDYKENFDFSTPYIVFGIQALTMKKNAGMIKSDTDLNGKKIGIYQYTSYSTANAPQAIIKTYDDPAVMYHDLSNGVIDIVLEKRFDAIQVVNAHVHPKDMFSDRKYETNWGFDPLSDLALSGELLSRQEVGIALRKGEPELQVAVNQAIERLRTDGTLKKISEKYFNADVTQ
jgi:cystine transport system substrate-binding protein